MELIKTWRKDGFTLRLSKRMSERTRGKAQLEAKSIKLQSERSMLYAGLLGHDPLAACNIPEVRRIKALTRQIDALSFQIAQSQTL